MEMATYDWVFNSLGLNGWCGSGGSGAPTSLADLTAQAGGSEGAETGLWSIPFPSLDALNDACPAFPQSRDVTRGLEQGFLDVKDAMSFVLDPITQPLSWALEGALYGILNTPWWIVIPLLMLITWAVSRSWGLLSFVTLSIMGLAFIDHYDYAMQTLAIIFVCAFICVLIGVPIGIAMSRSDRVQRATIPVLDMLQTLPPFVYLIPLIGDRTEALRHRHHPLRHRAGDPIDESRHPDGRW
jgi:glycine betaine/proline transport system permease protein